LWSNHDEEMPDMTNHEDEAVTEAAMHAMLRLVADFPGQMGRLRVARVVGGYAIRAADAERQEQLARYAVECGGSLREIVELVDALIAGGLVVQTVGQRPTLVLSRVGFRALEALEAGAPDAGRAASGEAAKMHACT
jgi:hypothetical protein